MVRDRTSTPCVDYMGNPTAVSSEATHNLDPTYLVQVLNGEVLANLTTLAFRDPSHFSAGELHYHANEWSNIIGESPASDQAQVLDWVTNKVSVFPYFKHFTGLFGGASYDSDRPPRMLFKNNLSCRPFVKFIQETILDRLESGAITLSVLLVMCHSHTLCYHGQ